MPYPILRLKKNEDRRIRSGHLWIYSNEVDVKFSPLKNFSAEKTVLVESHDKKPLGIAYVNSHSLICARILSFSKQEETIDVAFFVKRFREALALRTRFFLKPYYRLVFGDSDFLPGLIIDRYDQVFVIQFNTAGMDARKEMIFEALKAVFPKTESIIIRNDSSARQMEGLPSEVSVLGTTKSVLTISENETHFEAPFVEGQKTGWFYDHRLNRSRLKEYVKDQTVLDVFSYLGAWGIQAASFGAKEVLCVDGSPLSKKWIPNNAALNKVEDKIQVLQDDAFDALKKLIADGKTFSVIIIDPPAFVKKQKDKDQGLLAYQRINELALKLLTPNGILISCSCSMHVSHEEFLRVLQRASLKTHCECQVLERGHQAPDHPVHLSIPETDYLKMVIARKILREPN